MIIMVNKYIMITIKNRLTNVIFSDLTPIRWTMGWVAFFMAAGFLVATTDNNNYNLVNMIAHQYTWAVIFFIHGVSLIYTSLFSLNYYCSKVISLIGIWIWSYVFLSFTVYDPTPIAATEWLLLIPILMEVWMIIEWKK